MALPGRKQDEQNKGGTERALNRRISVNRVLAQLVLLSESLAPLLLWPLSLAAVFLSLAWFGLFREMPALMRWPVVFCLVFGFVASLLPLLRLRFPTTSAADRMLEERNRLPHQPVLAQTDPLALDTPFARALYAEHRRRMAETISRLDPGFPRPDIARFDRMGLRAIPALMLAVAFAYSGSNGAGEIADALRFDRVSADQPGLRLDAWITPPAYTGRAPIFLTGTQGVGAQGAGTQGESAASLSVPFKSQLTIRVSGSVEDADAAYRLDSSGKTVAFQSPQKQDAQENEGQSLALTLAESGRLTVGKRQWAVTVVPDRPPVIAFDGKPKATVNGALEIGFTASDDYGLQEAHAEIVPVDADANAKPLYPLPDYRLDLPGHNEKKVKAVTSRNLSDSPWAGQKVRITLVAKDGLGQEGRSAPVEMIMPSRNFVEPLAAAVAEERQVFARDTRQLPRAIALNEALTLRADETIPNLSHYLLITSARMRMKLARNTDDLKDTADYLWQIALGIDGGELAEAEQKLAQAQKDLSDALNRNASDAEIKQRMDALRKAMQDYLKALAARQPPQNSQQAERNAQNRVLSEQDLKTMMDQIENLARSGNKDAAQQMLSQLQRLMNNLQTGRPSPPSPEEQRQARETRQQMEKLGRIMRDQQKLMDETFKLDQALQDRMQMNDGLDHDGMDGLDPDQQQDPGSGAKKQPSPGDGMSDEQLREALKGLRERQDQLGKQLGEVQKGLGKLGIDPGQKFGDAGKEMGRAGRSLGEGDGEGAVQSQGRALEALRQGAREMMNRMMQAMRGSQGQPGGNQAGRDPLGRPRPNSGPETGEEVKIPDNIDVQRAREILDAIREKLGDQASPEEERRYLERLLDLQ
ncbi:TIGR02302 family protein [Allorhizobium sp. BGMRC 0089]|uniref:TIGR02302 family protein n=1 Tax=Allorhizobium sonneratiae TaxID=2934936 RepID=UPI002033DBA7|nr:TIGR02302 family protein [Allorhizobium sonneratiae]MCM2293475.1 TIGR02302 family protein [Allorhizobium sonneratiae]